MKLCPNCGTLNREGMFFCEECGQDLREGNATISTKEFEERPSDLASRATWGTASFGKQQSVIVHIRDVAEPIKLPIADRTIVGRADETSVRQPDFDLTPHGALEKGVSRIHAAIERSDDTLTLVDMGSSNGTYLNGQRLLPDQPRVLRDGDEIRFGKLVAHIYFK
jgi:hypothetical protein